MELIQPTKQQVWGWPGVVNFILGGMATGFYLLSSLAAILRGASQAAGFKLLASVLVGLGFLALTTEAGQPLRGYHLFRHLRRSWMSRETLAGIIFVLIAALDWRFPHPALWGLASAAAAGLMISHGFILYRVRGVTAWNVPPMPLVFLSSGLAMGGGLVLLVASIKLALEVGTVVIGLIFVVLDLVVWLFYLYGIQDAAFRGATERLRRSQSLVLVAGIGHLLPVLLLSLLLVVRGISPMTELWHAIAALAGLAMVIGGMGQKAGIVLRTGYLRGIVLDGLKGDARGKHPVFPFSPPTVHAEERIERP